jgi:threonine aldolase
MPPTTIDLRSDTVTRPSPEMREAMYRAELGDDVYGEDPDVNRLEELAAEKMGKEAAVLVTSGTQGNLVSVLSHCQRGDEVVVGDQAHVLHYEVAGVAALGGIQLRPVPNGRGLPAPKDVESAIRGVNIHNPPTRLLCLENTHNRASGAVFSAEEMGTVISVARRHGVSVHLDGARIFNAAVALGVPAKELVREVDSVTFCLSKGLAAPVGSLICGSKDYIQRARKFRKMVGGGLRQAGIIAAPGLVALTTMVDRLAEDHDNARILAEGLAELPGIILDPRTIQSNIVIFDLAESVPTDDFLGKIRADGVLANATAPQRIRMVTHYGITAEDVKLALAVCGRALRGR